MISKGKKLEKSDIMIMVQISSTMRSEFVADLHQKLIRIL